MTFWDIGLFAYPWPRFFHPFPGHSPIQNSMNPIRIRVCCEQRTLDKPVAKCNCRAPHSGASLLRVSKAYIPSRTTRLRAALEEGQNKWSHIEFVRFTPISINFRVCKTKRFKALHWVDNGHGTFFPRFIVGDGLMFVSQTWCSTTLVKTVRYVLLAVCGFVVCWLHPCRAPDSAASRLSSAWVSARISQIPEP